MKINSSTIDLTFTDDMDFMINDTLGDMKTTSQKDGSVLSQMIIKRVFASKGDWKIHPQTGSNLNLFKGFKVDENTIFSIKSTIIDELNREMMISAKDVEVMVFPLSKTDVAIAIIATVEGFEKPVVITTEGSTLTGWTGTGFSLDTYNPTTNKLRGS